MFHILLLFEKNSVLLTSPIPINSNKNRVEDNEVRQGGGGGGGGVACLAALNVG